MNLEQYLRSKKIKEMATKAAKKSVEEIVNNQIDLKPSNSIELETLDHPEDYTSPNCKKFDERVNSND